MMDIQFHNAQFHVIISYKFTSSSKSGIYNEGFTGKVRPQSEYSAISGLMLYPMSGHDSAQFRESGAIKNIP